MLIILLFNIAALCYAGAYLFHCFRRKRYLGAAGTGILLVLALMAGFLLLAYVS
ncbi:MAG TPA: hypothetical protein PKX46_04415 [Clostridia bacterium]|nr:hypothetical protein [Clostridia bacterium]